MTAFARLLAANATSLIAEQSTSLCGMSHNFTFCDSKKLHPDVCPCGSEVYFVSDVSPTANKMKQRQSRYEAKQTAVTVCFIFICEKRG